MPAEGPDPIGIVDGTLFALIGLYSGNVSCGGERMGDMVADKWSGFGTGDIRQTVNVT